jgi:hypothetical protein
MASLTHYQLDDVEAVVIRNTRKQSLQGKHALVEKPLTSELRISS